MNRSQMLKGLLEGCILKIISAEETYGYKITEDLNRFGFANLNEGTVYPLLMRLEKKGLIKSAARVSPMGPKRKYFTISNAGSEYLADFSDIWDEVSAVVENIMSKGGRDV